MIGNLIKILLFQEENLLIKLIQPLINNQEYKINQNVKNNMKYMIKLFYMIVNYQK